MISLIRGSDNFDSANTAGNLSWGGVKTLGLLGDADGSPATQAGDTIAGSSLDRVYSIKNSSWNTVGAALSGTWRCMGRNGTGQYGTLFMRIS